MRPQRLNPLVLAYASEIGSMFKVNEPIHAYSAESDRMMRCDEGAIVLLIDVEDNKLKVLLDEQVVYIPFFNVEDPADWLQPWPPK